MSNKLSIVMSLMTVSLVFHTATLSIYAQDMDVLLNQLQGKVEAPQRNAEQLAQVYEKAIDYLLPLMSADDIGSRYNYQIALQDIGSYASRPGAETERRTLARLLCRKIETAEMPSTVRNWFVLQVERIGKEESVETLTNLLSTKDKELRDYARRALVKNPSQAALRSLERALKQAEDSEWKNTLLQSLAERSRTDAADGSTAALEKAAAIMTDSLKKVADADQITIARMLIHIAGELVKLQKFDQAMNIYDDLNNWATERGPDVFFIRAAALNGIAMCDGQRAVEVVTLAMKSENPKIRSIAVQAARNAPTKDATQALTRMLSELDPYSQKQVLGLIADRGDLSSTKFVKEVLARDDESVRLAAIDALTQIGGDEAAEALLEIAANDEGAAKKAAVEGLSVMVGPRVEEVIKDQAASGNVNARVVAIGLLGDRHASGAGEILLGYAADDNGDICAAAFKALAAVADSGDIAMLADLLAKTTGSEARGHGVAALKSVLAKAEDKDAAARIIIDRMKTSGAEAKISLLSSLNALGGSAALETAVEATQSSDEALCEAGIRTLSDWPDYEAAEKLLGIAARPETALNHYVLAMRGALRLIRISTSAPPDDRAALCFYAFDQARRDEEKKQAVSAMGSVPGKKVAARLLGLTADDKLRTEAGLAAVELAGNMLTADRQAARDLAQKIRDLNISDEINRRADSVIKGRRRR